MHTSVRWLPGESWTRRAAPSVTGCWLQDGVARIAGCFRWRCTERESIRSAAACASSRPRSARARPPVSDVVAVSRHGERLGSTLSRPARLRLRGSTSAQLGAGGVGPPQRCSAYSRYGVRSVRRRPERRRREALYRQRLPQSRIRGVVADDARDAVDSQPCKRGLRREHVDRQRRSGLRPGRAPRRAFTGRGPRVPTTATGRVRPTG